jgi:gamma-polyglutamate synthase
MWLTASSPFFFCLSLWAGLVAYLHWESSRHERCREKIPLRIHVNGTRGKSSVTRLVAAGLRAGGLRVLAKTTGSSPRLIRADGSEELLKRRGPANIRENLGFLRAAAFAGADAVVVECMALRPDLQWTLEHRIIKSHIGVITNIRSDHEDIMGKGLGAVAKALAQTIPSHGTLVTTVKNAALLREVGGCSSESALHLAPESLPEEYLSPFPYEVFTENVALALAVCQHCGVESATALEGMHRAGPDAGNARVHRFAWGNKTVCFINAFAANDPDSTMLLWNRFTEEDAVTTIVILNARADRRFRTMQLCRLLEAIHCGLVVATGDSSFVKRHLRLSAGIRLVTASRKDCPRVLQQAFREAHGPLVQVFGAGNTQGMDPLLATVASLESV